jgi:hypothetical protein
MGKGHITEIMNAGRILSHGKITSLTAAFSLATGHPFSLFIIPKSTSVVEPLVASVKLYQDDAAANCPFSLRCWTETAVVEVGATAIDLTAYDVYWGAGADVTES